MTTTLSTAQAALVLNALPHIGPISLNRLLSEWGDPAAILNAPHSALERVKGIGPAAAASIRDWRRAFDLEREERRLAETGSRFLTRFDPSYPALLAGIHDPPIGLYCRGPYDLRLPAVALVGSRRTTLYGQRVAREFAGELARRGYCVVSGMARGIDTAAHTGALEAGGRTVAVLGCGLDIIYPPENLDLYRQIAGSGLVISEFPFGRRADRQTFPMRNRVISGLCEAVVIVESDASGGSMITARFAGEQGRQVLAVPGRIDQASSRGCHELIRDGAILCTRVEDILQELRYVDGLMPVPLGAAEAAAGQAGPPLGAREDRLMACFRGGEVLNAEQAARLARLTPGEAGSGLVLLELRGMLRKRLDGSFEEAGASQFTAEPSKAASAESAQTFDRQA